MVIKKYRAWHIERKEYLSVDVIDFIHKTIESNYEIIPFEQVILEPFTGQIDRNGEDVYLGDLVVSVHDTTVPYEIIFNEVGLNYMFLMNEKRRIGQSFGGHPSWYEKVGNVHEGRKEFR